MGELAQMIIDSHCHVGMCRVFGAQQDVNQLFLSMERHGVDRAIVQPFPGSMNPTEDHSLIGRMDHKKIRGIASMSPHRDAAEYRAEIQRCAQELGFVGVKLHTIGHSISPLSPDARLVFETAADLSIPVMIHTGPGVPFAEPAAWIPLSREFSDTKVVFAHSGAGIYTVAAIAVAEVCENVFLETSWCNIGDIQRAIRTLGADRVMFGSDMIPNLSVEIAKFGALDISAEERSAVMYGTAQKVFGMEE